MSSGRDTGSPAGALSQHDLGRVLLHALQLGLVSGAAILVEWVSGQNWGYATPVVILAATTALDALRRWASDTRGAR